MEMREASIVGKLDVRTQAFELRFLRIVTFTLTLGALIALISFAISKPAALTLLCVGAVLAFSGTAFGLTFAGEQKRASLVFLVGTSLGGAAALALGDGGLGDGSKPALLFVAVLAPFLLSRSETWWFTAFEVGLSLLAHLKLAVVDARTPDELIPSAVGTGTVIVMAVASISSFVAHANANQETLRQRLLDIDLVVDRAHRIARGDLSGAVEGDSEVSRVVAAMLAGLRGLVEQIQGSAAHLAQASNEISAMAQQQEKSAIEQGGAIEETRRTVGLLLQGSRQIASSARAVTDNAGATLHNAEVITERIRTLSEHAQRITEILELIRDVANKSELLALNAALEGAKAGEAGRGFSLVAAQMQRLAESVMESVKVVKELTSDIRKATQSTALATEDATKLASDTNEAARRIGVITQEQEGSTEQVTRAMDEIADATHQSAAGTNQTLHAVRELSQIAEQLNAYVAQFQL